MPITITAIERSPDGGRGLARDMPVRWALEEVGQSYDARLVSFAAMKEPTHKSLHPFGQIPTYEDGEVVIFESGAIVLDIALHNAGLLPEEGCTRAGAIAWLFAALSTIEPPIVEFDMSSYTDGGKPWYHDRLPMLADRVRTRLGDLSNRLGNKEWLNGAFSVGDLMMVTVLRRLSGSGLLEEHQSLSDYVARGEDRPAFKRAFASQLAAFNASTQAAQQRA